MPRYAKAAALDLINFAKKLSIRANYFDRTSGSAFEFARQMGSPHLLKKNPGFEFSFVIDEESARPASLRAEFINGQVWEVETGEMHCSELRSEVDSVITIVLYAIIDLILTFVCLVFPNMRRHRR